MKLGEILIQNQWITPAQLNEALEIQAKQPEQKIGEILVRLGYITSAQLHQALETGG